ncbi:MAG TPA: cytochrome P450 [Acidimicrobiales bacterium]
MTTLSPGLLAHYVPDESVDARSDDPETVLDAILDPVRRGELYPLYRRLRELAPVHHTTNERLHRTWVVTSFDEAMAVFRSPSAVNDPATCEIFNNGGSGGAFYQTMRGMMLFLESDDHARLRRLVIPSFTPRSIERLRPVTQRIADELVDAVIDDRSMELVAQFAYPLPIRVIANILGVPDSDHPLIEALARDFARAGDLSALTPEIVRRGDDAASGFADYFGRMVELRRRDPGDDVLSALAGAEADGERLTGNEIVATAVLLMQAGHETTADLVGNAMVALFRHPDELRRLQSEPEITKIAVEEFLRYDGSVQLNHRLLTEDMRVGPVTVPAGEVVAIFLGAANRDPARFLEPDRLDLTRAPAPHIGFSYGAYYCVGASLARTETQVALRTLLDRLPGIRPAADTFQWRNTLTLRGPHELAVAW